ncbi:hypothetical protein J1614_004929 [Plenodomus biglobosus]|nr:hypothetical protein J1614_004929 [Plenodomus biglobosus]
MGKLTWSNGAHDGRKATPGGGQEHGEGETRLLSWGGGWCYAGAELTADEDATSGTAKQLQQLAKDRANKTDSAGGAGSAGSAGIPVAACMFASFSQARAPCVLDSKAPSMSLQDVLGSD